MDMMTSLRSMRSKFKRDMPFQTAHPLLDGPAQIPTSGVTILGSSPIFVKAIFGHEKTQKTQKKVNAYSA